MSLLKLLNRIENCVKMDTLQIYDRRFVILEQDTLQYPLL